MTSSTREDPCIYLEFQMNAPQRFGVPGDDFPRLLSGRAPRDGPMRPQLLEELDYAVLHRGPVPGPDASHVFSKVVVSGCRPVLGLLPESLLARKGLKLNRGRRREVSVHRGRYHQI
ncbi:MAG: hypothetical protein AMXMBFR64_62770 [Myxococcales bacterium]